MGLLWLAASRTIQHTLCRMAEVTRVAADAPVAQMAEVVRVRDAVILARARAVAVMAKSVVAMAEAAREAEAAAREAEVRDAEAQVGEEAWVARRRIQQRLGCAKGMCRTACCRDWQEPGSTCCSWTTRHRP